MSANCFAIWDAANPADVEAWSALWASWPAREVQAHPSYIKLNAEAENRALCAAYQSAEGCVLYPFILRDLTIEPFWSDDMPPATDIITPYGYGGPFTWGGSNPDTLARAFWMEFDAWAASQHIVSEFVRFSLFPDIVLLYAGEKIEERSNVVRDLALDLDLMWMDFEHKVRKNVNRARKERVEVVLDHVGEELDAFLRIYHGTMNRREARESYYFPRAYFEMINRELAGQFAYFFALHENRPIAAELVLISAENVYSFLGGTEAEAFHLRPNDLLKFEIIRWAKAAGKRRFVLGGGYQPDDGIFKYKLAFAPKGRVSFYTGRRILAPDVYDRLVEHKAALSGGTWTPAPDFFPTYRA